MKDNQSKKYIALMSVSVLCLIVIITAGTYAYFKPNIVGSGTTMQVGSGKVKLQISNAKVTPGPMIPIKDSTKSTKAHKNEFSLSRTSDSTMDACYQLSLEIENIGSNLINKFFKYELTYDGSKTITGNFSGVTLDENGKASIPLLYNQTLNASTTSHSYVLRVWLSYSDTEDQTSLLQGDTSTRSFTGHLKASGYNGACKTS